MDYKQELIQLERNINNKKLEQARLEERKKQLEEERNTIIKQLTEENINEEQLENTITELEIEIEEQINQCKQILK